MLVEGILLLIGLVLLLHYCTQVRPSNYPPGPTGIPIVGYLPFLQLPIHEGFVTLSKKYGNIFSLFLGNFRVVVLGDWDLQRKAFNDDRFSGRPPLRLFKQRGFGKQRGIIFSTDHTWREQRRFAMKGLRDLGYGRVSMEELIKDEVIDLVNEFKQELNTPVDLQMRFNTAVLNAFWHVVAGERYAHSDARMRTLVQQLSEELDNAQMAGSIWFMPWLTKIAPKWTGLASLLGAMYDIYGFLEEKIQEHRVTRNPSQPRDLFDIYLHEIENCTDPRSSFRKGEGDKEMLVSLLDLFIAGADTTSTSLSWAVLYMITHPEVQEKVQTEVDRVVGHHRLPALADRKDMPYMEAFIAETFRHSAIGGLVIHATTEDVDLGGYRLPKDTIVMGNMWQCHHDPKYWGDPSNFRPERFLNPDGTFRKDPALNPFAVGKRTCLGESLARDEMFLFLTGILQHINFEVNPEAYPSLEPKMAFVTRTTPYTCIMKSRKIPPTV